LNTDLVIHVEPLEPDELDFLVKKEHKERAQYYQFFSIMMFLSFLIPFVGSWYRAYDGAPDAFSKTKFFLGAGILMSLSAGAVYYAYRRDLRKLRLDLRKHTKTIEVTHIKTKKYMPQNNSYHFYLQTTTRMSIEVSQAEFYRLNEGDEITIEYATHSKFYLGHY
jgi:hypothetical protein